MSTLTPKENYIRVLTHQVPEWIPNARQDEVNYIPPEIAERAPGDGSIEQALGGTGFDWFGVHWVFQPHVRAATVSHEYPPILTDIKKWKEQVKFPDLEAIDWAAAAERDKDVFVPEKLANITLLNGPFERMHALMGMSEACMALLIEPEASSDFFSAVVDHKIRVMEKILEYYPVDQIELHDDWGHQENQFFSTEVWNSLLAPHIKRLTEFGKEKNIFLRFHSCGKIENLIPSMIEAGIEHWTSAQTINDIEGIIKKYGDRLVLTGGMDMASLKLGAIPKDEMKSIVEGQILNLCRGGALLPLGASAVVGLKETINEILEENKDFFKKPDNCLLPV